MFPLLDEVVGVVHTRSQRSSHPLGRRSDFPAVPREASGCGRGGSCSPANAMESEAGEPVAAPATRLARKHRGMAQGTNNERSADGYFG